MSKISLIIDGKNYLAEQGSTILQVARENGIEIPTLCHNDQISHTTSCFVCTVKDNKTGRFLPSCSVKVVEDMDLSSESPEVAVMRKTALDLLLSEHTGDCEAPCTFHCPAHASVEEYVREGKNGNHLKGLAIIKERIPLPMSIGRVCPRFCEKNCRRNVIDHEDPVAINDFKRLAADLHYEKYMEERAPLNGKKVAIIGAGPAGLSTAYHLRLNGVSSDIYEKMPKPGGMLRYGIPEYRLPKNILDKEIAHFDKMGGIKIFCNKTLGKDVDMEKLKKEYDAVAVTLGSWKSSSMRCEGEEYAENGISWLEKIALRDWSGDNPGKTVVIGGGNTAMDCVRTAVRLGSKEVICCYRRTEKEMPAERIEIEEAKEEGVNFQFLTAPIKLHTVGNKKILTCQKMELGEPDASGRRRPVPIDGSEFVIEADMVIAAVGQKTDAPSILKTNKWGDIDVNKDNNQMDDKVFAAGDCVTGPATVVEAVAEARIAAMGILSYLDGGKYKEPYRINVSRGNWQSLKSSDLLYLNEPVSHKRQKQQHISLSDRKNSFKEVSYTFSKEEVEKEGERCIECSCTAKEKCKLKEYSEKYNASPDTFDAKKSRRDFDTRHPKIVLDRNKCVKCGVCVKICKEVVNKTLLGFQDRGYATHIGTALDSQLPESCSECGACVEACPVAALDWKEKK